MKLSKNFSLEELSSTDHRDLFEANRAEAQKFIVPLTRVATELLEPIRELFKKPIMVNSGYRGKRLNAIVGGSDASQHCKGEAADIRIKDWDSEERLLLAAKKIYADLPNLKFGQLLVEYGCLHISLGTKRELAYYDVATKTKRPIKP